MHIKSKLMGIVLRVCWVVVVRRAHVVCGVCRVCGSCRVSKVARECVCVSCAMCVLCMSHRVSCVVY